jgi:hypothetical protein
MDERKTVLKKSDLGARSGAEREALAWKLADVMEAEAALFQRLGLDVDRLRDSFQAKQWTDSLTLAQGFEAAARDIEAVDKARDNAFSSLKCGFGLPSQEPFSAVLSRMAPGERSGLEGSWRRLKTEIFRLKMATGRLRYSAETMGDTLSRFIEGLFPHRRGKIYTRHGTPEKTGGALIIDKEL